MRSLPLLLGVACTTATTPPADTDLPAELVRADVWAAPGPHGVGVRTLTLVDTTRTTPANGEEPSRPERTLDTQVWYPSDVGTPEGPVRDASALPGPHPVLVFAHGFMSSQNDHALLGASLASRGWIFVAPRFPLSNLTTPGGATVLDILNQADDMGFLLDAVLGGADDLTWLDGRVDPERVVFGGMSLGGTTAMLAGLYAPARDPRVKAIVAVAPAACMLPLSSFDSADLPLLLVHGDADAFVSLEGNATPAYAESDGPKALVTLAAGTHTGFPDATAGLFDAMPNADAIGCGAAGGALTGLDEAEVEALLPPGTPLLTDGCSTPCAGTLVEPAMRPLRQGVLLRASAAAFLAAVIDGDEEAGRWLAGGLEAAETDVTVMAEGIGGR